MRRWWLFRAGDGGGSECEWNFEMRCRNLLLQRLSDQNHRLKKRNSRIYSNDFLILAEEGR
ncbi:uncharacterized protein DS421_17g598210 [Arachis hypogaea]|nr:uncharacterized protein DS421_17g598210 [Arachis hypogaea]